MINEENLSTEIIVRGDPELTSAEFRHMLQTKVGDYRMINEDQLAAEIMRRFKGRIVLAVGAAIGVGFVLGAMIF